MVEEVFCWRRAAAVDVQAACCGLQIFWDRCGGNIALPLVSSDDADLTTRHEYVTQLQCRSWPLAQSGSNTRDESAMLRVTDCFARRALFHLATGVGAWSGVKFVSSAVLDQSNVPQITSPKSWVMELRLKFAHLRIRHVLHNKTSARLHIICVAVHQQTSL